MSPRGWATASTGGWSGRVHAARAWAYPWIDLQDAGSTWAAMQFDVEDREDLTVGLKRLPEANFCVITPRGAHVTWCLAEPVGKHPSARGGPVRYLSAVAEYWAHVLRADRAFSGLGRNPAHPEART